MSDMGTRSHEVGLSRQQTPIAKINTLVGCPMAWAQRSGEDRSFHWKGRFALS